MIRNMLIRSAALATLTLAGWSVPAQANQYHRAYCGTQGNNARCEARFTPVAGTWVTVDARLVRGRQFSTNGQPESATVQMWSSICGISGIRMSVVDQLIIGSEANGKSQTFIGGFNPAPTICIEAYVLNCRGPSGAMPCAQHYNYNTIEFWIRASSE